MARDLGGCSNVYYKLKRDQGSHSQVLPWSPILMFPTALLSSGDASCLRHEGGCCWLRTLTSLVTHMDTRVNVTMVIPIIILHSVHVHVPMCSSMLVGAFLCYGIVS